MMMDVVYLLMGPTPMRGTFMAKFFDLFGFACMDRTQLYPKHNATKHDATNSTAPNRSTLSRWERCGPAHPFGVMTARPLILPPWSSRRFRWLLRSLVRSVI